MITSQVECEKALRSLGKSLGDIISPGVTNMNVNSTFVPAGCYWKSGGKGYFNNIVDPTLTDPNDFGFRGGVCMGMGKSC